MYERGEEPRNCRRSLASIGDVQVDRADRCNNNEGNFVTRCQYSGVVCPNLKRLKQISERFTPRIRSIPRAKTHLVRSIAILRNAIGPDDYPEAELFLSETNSCANGLPSVSEERTNTVDLVMLEQRPHHRIANHDRWYLQR